MSNRSKYALIFRPFSHPEPDPDRSIQRIQGELLNTSQASAFESVHWKCNGERVLHHEQRCHLRFCRCLCVSLSTPYARGACGVALFAASSCVCRILLHLGDIELSTESPFDISLQTGKSTICSAICNHGHRGARAQHASHDNPCPTRFRSVSDMASICDSLCCTMELLSLFAMGVRRRETNKMKQ